MKVVQFGGPIGDVLEPKMGVVLHPLCSGQASLPDTAPDAALAAAQNVLLKHAKGQIERWIAGGKGVQFGAHMPQLIASIAAAATAELGLQVNLGSLEVHLSDADRAALGAFGDGERRRRAEAEGPSAAALGTMPTAPIAAVPAAPYPPGPALTPAPYAAPAPPPYAAPAPPAYAAPAPAAVSPGAPPAPKKSSSMLYVLVGVGVLVVFGGAGLVWHFTHERPAAPAAHEHGHGKH